MLRILCVFLSLVPVFPFSFMGSWKIPTLDSIGKSMRPKKFENKQICIITGTSSGLGKQTLKQLLANGNYHVIGAVRDLDKMALVCEEENLNTKDFTAMKCDLASFQSVREFADKVKVFCDGEPIERIVCNAAVYQPSLDYAKYSEDDIEMQMQSNYLSHFLLVSLLMPEMREATNPRVIAVGSVTGNDNTVGGGGVYPIADLHDLEGLALGAKKPIAMMDGYPFNGAKAYKDSKLSLMMMTNILHEKYHKSTKIAFSSIYPGCIAESPLFREKRPWFRKYFPVFMKYITGGFVGEEEAGSRLYQVISDPRCTRSGVYWSWNGGPREGRIDSIKNKGSILGAGGAGGGWDSIYENDQSDKVLDNDKANLLFKLSTEVTGANWQPVKQPISPCPTLKVIGVVTALLENQEKMKRAALTAGLGRSAQIAPSTMKEAMQRMSF